MSNNWVKYHINGVYHDQDGFCLHRMFKQFLIALLIVVSFASYSFAELPSPQFMPGFPMIAGPQLMIMWQPVPGAAKYKVFINGKEAAESTAFQHFMPTPEKAGVYEIQIQAVAADGTLGKLSDIRNVKIVKLEPPKNLVGRFMADSFAIRWDNVQAAMIYNVFRSTEPGGEYKLLASVQDTRYVDKNYTNDKKYYYVVSAKDSTGAESGRSNEIAFNPAAEIEKRKVEKREQIEQAYFTVEMLVCVDALEIGGMSLPNGITRDAGGNIYVRDNKNRILVFNTNYKVIKEISKLSTGSGPVSISPDQKLFIGDSPYIKVASLDGNIEKTYDLRKLETSHNLKNPRAWAATSFAFGKDNIYVGDSFGKRILVFDKNLRFQSHLDVSELAGTVSNVSLTSSENIVFTDVLGAKVIEITKDGKLVRKFGEFGAGAGQMARANTVIKDPEGNYWVSDNMNTLIHVFNNEGEYMFDFGKSEVKAFSVKASLFGEYDPSSRIYWYTQSLENNFCAIRVPDFK